MIVRSENAAKPMSQPSAGLVRWLRSRAPTRFALDYGCGKLRYTRSLALRSTEIGLVDSSVQLDRMQTLNGRIATVSQVAKQRWPSCRIYTIQEFWHGVPERYGFVLCANVLSTIPSRALRDRSLTSIRDCLESSGQFLVVNQHTNSYFRQARSRPDAVEHLDGWILPSGGGASYYGVLDRSRTIGILQRAGFEVEHAWVDGQSNYVLGRK